MTETKKFTIVATCAAGLEELTAGESANCGGIAPQPAPGMVRFQGDLASVYRMCLWSRFASKVLVEIAAFEIDDADGLYRRVGELDWSDHLTAADTFSVSSTLSAGAVIDHSHYAALRVKDGVVDAFRQAVGTRPDVARIRPDVKIHLHIEGRRASLFVDMSGESLHRRGYRRATGAAPLKETLAAAVVTLSGWTREVLPDQAFVDPMCGSATLLIEAAMIWGDTAPGLSRKYYGFKGWRGHDETLWARLVDEALDREEARLSGPWPSFLGGDNDEEVVAAARQNIAAAGLDDRIGVRCLEMGLLQPPAESGFLVSNLPYGERLSEKEEVRCLYSCLGNMLKGAFHGYRAGLLLADPDAVDRLGLQVEASHRLFNGPLACRLLRGRPVEAGQPRAWKPLRAAGGGEGADFANRLRKNANKLRSWAETGGIECYRLYDRDIPEYNMVVDIYKNWLYVQEYAPPSSIDADLAGKRFSTALAVLRETFQVGRDAIFIRRRRRQKGKSQYQKRQAKEKFHQVAEGDCSFLVNFSNYLDTGLFLDHRPLRLKLAEISAGKRFLNLFGYTGTATVQAAKGGAAQTTTVDLSARYLDWAAKNLALNGFTGKRHQLVAADCLSWLTEARAKYDLILVDPPTFSNTKKKKRVFDIQRDQVELIERAVSLLDREGTLYFSTNFRKFRLDPELQQRFNVEDLSGQTIPPDFRRNPQIHKCFRICVGQG